MICESGMAARISIKEREAVHWKYTCYDYTLCGIILREKNADAAIISWRTW